MLVTKTRTMKPDEGTLAVRYTLEEEKNRPSGQCAVEPSPRCMIQDQRVNRNSRL